MESPTVNVADNLIHLIRGQRVMLDADLAELYGVATKELNKAVKRNQERFPADFMFQLSREEADNLRFQFGTSSWGGRRYLPFVFTEQGVSMLSSVLRSRRAVLVNIGIMRTFVRMRQLTGDNKALAAKLAELERRVEGQDGHIRTIFRAIHELMEPPAKPAPKIGFQARKK